MLLKASDYCASDAGEGPDDIPDDLTCSSPPPKSKQASIEKYCSRAANMLANPAVQINEWHGLPFNTEYWVCRMARFNKRENRWVDKGVCFPLFKLMRIVARDDLFYSRE